MEKTDWKRIGWLTAATLVLGAIIGACAGLLTLLLYGVEYMMLGFIESEFIPGAFTVPAVRRIASVTLGLGVAGVIWYLLRTKTEKVPSVKKAVNGGRMPFWQTIVHVVLQIFIVGSGASIGREVAPRELGAMLAQRFCDIFHFGDGEGAAHGVLDRRMVVAVAAGADMAHFTAMGAAGVQLATRFITTYECDASQGYKDVLLNARPEDVRIIHSPVGMPGRALNTPLVQALAEGTRFPPRHCARCLKTCDPAKVPYCIPHALIEAVKGNVEEGLFFCGANVGRLDRMRTVQELMDELVIEWRQNQ